MSGCSPRTQKHSVSFPFAIAVFALALACPRPLLAIRVLDKTAVTINNELILESDIEKFHKKLDSKSFRELFGGVDPKSLQTREGILQLLIEEKVIDQQVKKLDLAVSPAEVDAQIRLVTKRNGITEDQLKERLKQLGTPFTEYREAIRRQLERRNLIDREIKPTIEVTEEQLRRVYQKSRGPEDAGNEYKVAQIQIDGTGAASEKRAQQIYEEVAKTPDEWEKHVKDFSQDKSALESGGLLGSFPANHLAKEFRDVVLKTPAGQITKPIKTKSGYHILKVLDVHPVDFASIPKERKEAIRNQIAGAELEKKMATWLERKKSESQIKRFDVASTTPAPTGVTKQ